MLSPKTGSALQNDLDNLTFEAAPMIDDFMYEQTVVMIAADPGVGKSVIATQIAISLTSATPVFGFLKVPREYRVYYMQLEGSYHEFVSRMRQMREEVPIKTANLCWDACEGINVAKEDHVQKIIGRVRTWGKPDLIVVDPIYMAVAGGLSKDEVATSFVRFSNRLRQEFDCTNLLVHHTHRPKYSNEGSKVQEDDPFYGSQWLKAHVDTSYLLRSTDRRRHQVILENKKSRGMNVEDKIALQFSPESYTCMAMRDVSENDALLRLLKALDEAKNSGISPTSGWLIEHAKISLAHLKRLSNEPPIKNKVTFRKGKYGKIFWMPKSS